MGGSVRDRANRTLPPTLQWLSLNAFRIRKHGILYGEAELSKHSTGMLSLVKRLVPLWTKVLWLNAARSSRVFPTLHLLRCWLTPLTCMTGMSRPISLLIWLPRLPIVLHAGRLPTPLQTLPVMKELLTVLV